MIKKLTYALIPLFIFACSSSDSNEEIPSEISLSSVSTSNPSGVSEDSAEVGGSVTDDGGGNVTERGIAWGLGSNPTIADNKKSSGSGTGNFSTTLTGLDSNTQYFIRAYAINSKGTAYGNQQQFSTLEVQPQNKIFEGDVLLRSQEEIDDFGSNGYTEITGTLTITDSSNPSIENLLALSGLVKIGGDFFIAVNTLLNSLNGLDNLEEVGGSLQVLNNPTLQNLTGLSGFRKANNIVILGNDSIINIDGLKNVNEVTGGITIQSNDGLQNINAFGNVETMNGVVSISQNGSLVEILGFEKLTDLSVLDINNNENLITISSFASLSTINSRISINSNQSLAEISPFTSLIQITGSLNIESNSLLPSLPSFPVLTAVDEGIRIDTNPTLDDFCGLTNLIDNGWNESFIAIGNLYNPTIQDLQNGDCSP